MNGFVKGREIKFYSKQALNIAEKLPEHAVRRIY
jgi:hypothetical protein